MAPSGNNQQQEEDDERRVSHPISSSSSNTIATMSSSSASLRVSTTTTASTTTSTSATASASTRILSGSVGSLITALAVTPLEVVKVHLQQNATRPTTTSTTPSIPSNVTLCPRGCGTFILNNGLMDCVLPKCSVPYFDEYGNLKKVEFEAKKPQKIAATPTTNPNNMHQLGTFGMIRRIFIKDGLRGIYAGLGPTLIMGIPSTAFYYSVYDEFVATLRQNPHISQNTAMNSYVPLFAGSSARLLSSLLTAPLELIRTRQASAVGEGLPQVGMITEFRAIIRNPDGGGFRSLYKGLAPTLWRDVPFSGIYWLSLENFKHLYTTTLFASENSQQLQSSPFLQQAGISFLSGASAGMVAAACTTPFDVVKTRQQAVSETIQSVSRAEITPVIASCTTCCNHDGHVVYRAATATTLTATTTTAGVEGQQARHASVFSYMRTIYETEGVAGLWRGNQTRMIKVAPSCAIMITCYELGKRYFI